MVRDHPGARLMIYAYLSLYVKWIDYQTSNLGVVGSSPTRDAATFNKGVAMITELVIDRAKWGVGALLNRDGTMCCLGHLSVACGIPKSSLMYTDVGYTGPIALPHEGWTELPDFARNYNLAKLFLLLMTVVYPMKLRKRP